MLNNIGGKVGKMNITVTQLFSSLSDQDFMAIHEAGQLKTFCDALSLDLNANHEKDNTYTA